MDHAPDDPHFPGSAAPAGGDGASAMSDAHALLAQHERKVRALVTNETGLRFESLALFAQPLFELYDLDPAAAFELHQHREEADETTVAVLEAARVLWAYFSLPEAERSARYGALGLFLLGPEATDEDEADLDTLLDMLESHWEALTPEDLALAADDEHPVLDFDALLAHPAFAPPEGTATRRTYGPDRLSEMEARALFAQPLLEPHTDPDDLDAAMERADEYWTLARLHGVEREVYLDELVEALAIDEEEAEAIRAEALAMTERFRSLFPDQT